MGTPAGSKQGTPVQQSWDLAGEIRGTIKRREKVTVRFCSAKEVIGVARTKLKGGQPVVKRILKISGFPTQKNLREKKRDGRGHQQRRT